jgi:two-component system, LytTR family, response regulator
MTINIGLRNDIELSEIIYLKAKINYTHIHLINGKQITVSKTLKTFEDELFIGNFFRIDRGHIVNLFYVKQLYKSGRNMEIELSNNIKIPIARRRRGDFNKFTRMVLKTPIKKVKLSSQSLS